VLRATVLPQPRRDLVHALRWSTWRRRQIKPSPKPATNAETTSRQPQRTDPTVSIKNYSGRDRASLTEVLGRIKKVSTLGGD
jgi:hypothetical protein